MKKVEILITDKDRFQIWTQDAFSEDFKAELDLYLFDTMVRQISVHQYTAFVIVNQEEHLYTLIEKMRKYTFQDVLYFCVTTLDGKTIVFHPTKVAKGVIENFLRMGEVDTVTPIERLTFEQLVERYGKYMSPEQRVELWLNVLINNPDDKELRKSWLDWLFPKTTKGEKLNNDLRDYLFHGRSVWHKNLNTKQKAEQQLKNIAPMLAGDSMTKNGEEQEPKRECWAYVSGFVGFPDPSRFVAIERKRKPLYEVGDYVVVGKEVAKITNVLTTKHGTWYQCAYKNDDGWVKEKGIDRKATTLEIIQHKAMYDVADFVVVDGYVYQIGDRGFYDESGEIVYVFVDNVGEYEKQDNIERKATKGEILQHQHGLEKGDWVLLEMGDIRWSQPRKFNRFTDGGAIVADNANGDGSSSYGYVFKKLPKDFDLNKDVIKLK